MHQPHQRPPPTSTEQDYETMKSNIVEKSKILIKYMTIFKMDNESIYPIITKYFKPFFKDDDVEVIIEDKVIENLIRRLMEDTMRVLLFGPSNSGKSSLLNGLIKNCDYTLPSYNGHCTPCCITLEGTNEQDGYLTKGSSAKRLPLEKLPVLCDIHKNPSNENLHVHLPRSNFLGPILQRDNLAVTEMPGLENDMVEDSILEFKRADVCVAIVDSGTKLDKDKFHLLVSKTKHILRPDVLVAYTKWDRIFKNDRDRMPKQKDELMRNAKEFLQRTDEEDEEDVFFLSSNDATMAQYSDTLSDLEGDIAKNSLVVMGADGVGKSTLVNMLVGQDVLATDNADTPRFISFLSCQNENESSWADCQGERYGIEDLKSLSSSHTNKEDKPLCVHISKAETKQSRLFGEGFKVTDSPSITLNSDAFSSYPGIWKGSSSIIIVVKAKKSIKTMQNQISKSVRTLANEEGRSSFLIFLVVSSWDKYLSKHKKHESRRKRKADIREMFKSYLKESEIQNASRKSFVYFFSQSSENRIGVNYREFQRFESRIQALTDKQYKAKKIEDRLNEIADLVSRKAMERWEKLPFIMDIFKNLIGICKTIETEIHNEMLRKQGFLTAKLEKAKNFFKKEIAGKEDNVIRFILKKYKPLEDKGTTNPSFQKDDEEPLTDENSKTCNIQDSCAPLMRGTSDETTQSEDRSKAEDTKRDLSFEPPSHDTDMKDAFAQFLKFCADDSQGEIASIQHRILNELNKNLGDSQVREAFRAIVADKFKECMTKNSSVEDFSNNLKKRHNNELALSAKENESVTLMLAAVGGVPIALAGLGAGIPIALEVGLDIGAAGAAAGSAGAAVGFAVGGTLGTVGGVVTTLIYSKVNELKIRQNVFIRLLREIFNIWKMEVQLQTFRIFEEIADNLHTLKQSLEKDILDFHRDYYNKPASSVDQLLLTLGSSDDQAFDVGSIELDFIIS